MTVSRVINGEANVRDETRALVAAAIAALRYAPNPAARSLAGAAQLRIGLLYSNPSAGFLTAFLLGGLDQAARSDVQVVVEGCEPGDGEIAALRHLLDGGIDGVVLPPPLCERPDVLHLLATTGVPAVAVGGGLPGEDGMAVRIDDRAAALAMVRHLVALGHRRIGFVTGTRDLSASGRRHDGYLAALAEAGQPVDPALIVEGQYTYRSGLSAAERLLDLADRPTAIFASNDDMAAACVAVAHRRSLDVPRDLTVCGFDDTTLSTAIWPELTTIRQPIGDMARAAVDLLVAAIRRPGVPPAGGPQRQLDFTLVRRQSDAPPLRP